MEQKVQRKREERKVQKNGSVITGQSFRISVLTDRLIRLEYSAAGSFEDRKTQTVTDRSFPVPAFQMEETEEALRITTDVLCLRYDKKAFSADGLSIALTGRYARLGSVWHYGEEPEDLGGTARTLDGADGEIPLEHGILSAHGWSVLDDSRSLILAEDGTVKARRDPKALDLYFFGYGRDYQNALADYYRLTGAVPLLPRFALGSWWSRYHQYTEQSYLELMDRFERENIPLTVAVVDMDWHLTEVDPKYGTGWTGYTWNRAFFPDPERFLAQLHRRGLKVSLNVHPADGVRAYEDAYPAFARFMGVDMEKEEPVRFTPGDSRFLEGYFRYVHHPLEEQGVDFWWIDWQQGTSSDMEGLDPLWILNHRHYLDAKERHARGLILSRYGGPGSHRYPIGFSGDTVITWKSLAFQPYFTAAASNIGYGWWSHDIGGHMRGSRDDELAVRWVQYGVFSPIMRLHSSNELFNGKEPWRYDRIAEEVMKTFLRLRHRLIPYLYAMNLRASREGVPLVQPLYYRHPDEQMAYQVRNEYYFGSELLVCPLTSPADRASGRAVFHGWLPEGLWTDLFTGLVYSGGRNIDLYRGIETIPVLMRGGAILVLDGREEGNAVDLPPVLTVCVNAVSDGAFTLWEDDGRDAAFREESWAQTGMRVETGKNLVFTVEPARGNVRILPEKRGYRLRFYGLRQGAKPQVCIDGACAAPVSCSYDPAKGIWDVELPEVSVGRTIRVVFSGAELHDDQRMSRIFDYLDRAQTAFALKGRIYETAGKAEQGVPTARVIEELRRIEAEDGINGSSEGIIGSADGLVGPSEKAIRPENGIIGPVEEILTAKGE